MDARRSFRQFAIRESARMTLERASAWGSAEGTLSSFMLPAAAKRGAAAPAQSDTQNDQGVAFALALRADGIASDAWLPLLELAHHPAAGEFARFTLRLLADGQQRPLLDFIGAPQKPGWDQLERAAEMAGPLFAVFRTAEAQGFSRLRQEGALRLAEAAQLGKAWSTADLGELRTWRDGLPEAYRPSLDARIAALERETLVRRLSGWVSLGVALHVGLWLALVTAYPHSRAVQAVFFWNPWVRRIVGLGYAVPLLLLVPLLRQRLVGPFSVTLIADARLDAFEPSAYYDRSWVRRLAGDRAEGARERLVDAIPEVRGHVDLEGASGLGKTQVLRLLASHSRRKLAFLPARRVAEAGGPLEAIQAKMQGWARDPDLIRSLLHVNALDVAIDGLNEVGADARARIVAFVEDLPKANVVLTTQPIAWEPPQAGATRRFELQPLDREQIAEFLLSRRPRIEELALEGNAYVAACRAFLDSTLSPALGAEERRANLVVLSNPMDLTLVAELIAAGEKPTLARLVEQQYERMATWYREAHGRDFPLAETAERAFELRRRNDNRLVLEAAALDGLTRFKLVLRRQSMDEPGKHEHHFRHDKIMEMFIAAHLLGAGRAEIDGLVGDSRFTGVLVELANLLRVGQAWALGRRIAEDAERTGEHWVSSAYMRRLLARADMLREAA
jgi:hypothetical protein